MGWDCFATRDDSRDLTDDDFLAFREAAQAVREVHGSVDGYLPTGGLNLSNCGDAIERLTSLQAWAEDPASAATVAGAARDLEPTGDFYEDNAVAFLNVCVAHHLGIYWSW